MSNTRYQTTTTCTRGQKCILAGLIALALLSGSGIAIASHHVLMGVANAETHTDDSEDVFDTVLVENIKVVPSCQSNPVQPAEAIVGVDALEGAVAEYVSIGAIEASDGTGNLILSDNEGHEMRLHASAEVQASGLSIASELEAKGIHATCVDDYNDEEHGVALGHVAISDDGVPRFRSIRAIGDSHAHDTGLITEWADDWFIAHSWSEPGLAILDMKVGMTAIVNNRAVIIEGIISEPADSDFEFVEKTINTLVGYDAVVFQTCLSEEDVMFAYGHYEN